MTTNQLSNDIIALGKEILVIMEQLDKVRAEQFKLKRELTIITENVRKTEYNLSRKLVERQIAERNYWASKNQ